MWAGAIEKQTILLNESVGCYLSQTNVLAPESKVSSVTHFELRDAAGTVFASVDSAGNITYHNYSPYAHRPVDPEWDNWLGFKGEVQLPDGGYYLGSYRVYDPLMMSFRTPDSASPFGVGGPATYAYCGGDPVNFHDPSGHVREEHFSYTFAPPLYTTREFRIGMAVAGIVLAPLGGGMLATALGAASGSLALASVLLEESDPALASALDVLAFGSGLASLAAGLSGGSRIASRALAGAAKRQNIVGGNQFFTKTMAGVDDYRFIDNYVTVYRDAHKGVPRLVVNLHGSPNGYGVTGAGSLRAEALIDFLEARGVPIRSYSKVKLHMCYSATPYDVHGSTFAKDMAYALKAEVKGYEGQMQLCGRLGEPYVPTPGVEFYEIPDFNQMKEMVGEETILRDWRPRKVEWMRDGNSRIVRGVDDVPALKSFENFKPVTYRCAPGSFKVEVIPGDHSVEKIMARWAKNKHAYVDPFAEDAFESELESGGLC